MRSNRARSLSRWLWLAALGGALAACEETETLAPAAPPELEVTPSGTLEMVAGDTLRLRVSVRNAADSAVAFSSTADSVASVSDAGLVTALRRGTATIIVSLVADPSRRRTVEVRVSDPPPMDDSVAAVRITGVFDPTTGATLDSAAVRGRALVRLEFSPGPATRLEVLAADSVICSQTFQGASSSLASAAIPFDCVVETARFDSVSGAVAFPNGPLPVGARLIGRADSVLAAASPVSLSLANRDTVLARLSAPRQALDERGLQWVDGPLTANAVPVVYGSTGSLATARFSYRAPGGETIVVVDSMAPFSIVLPEDADPSDGGLLGVADSALAVSVTTTLRSGAVGPRATTPAVRYDNQPPVPGGLLGREWIGARTSFQSLYDARGGTDAGVGRVAARFFAGAPAENPAEIISAGEEVEIGADLAEGGVGTYRFAALVCDALANCRVLEGFSFGVDLTAPSITGVGIADRTINPTQDFSISVTDNLSGFGARFMEATVTLLDADSGTQSCGPVVEQIDLPGRVVGGSCVPDSVSVLRTPRSTPGYFTYRVAAVDQAGNVGEAIARTILVDRTPPAIESLAVPSQLTPGRPVAVQAVARDNLDLLSASAFLVYPTPDGDRLALPFAAPDTAGVPFDGDLTTRLDASPTFPFVGTLTYPVSGRLVGARTVAADSLRLRVRDVARLAAEQGRALPATVPIGEPFASIDSVTASLDLQNVCTVRCLGTDATSAMLTVRLVGPAGFRNPLAEGGRVYFFMKDSTGAVTLLNSSGTASRSETGEWRVFTYSITVRPEPGLTGDFDLFAVGTSVAGSGLFIGEAPLHLFGR